MHVYASQPKKIFVNLTIAVPFAELIPCACLPLVLIP